MALGELWHWLVRRARPAQFSIRIRAGSAQLLHGRVPPGFVADCTAIAQELGCGDGLVDGVPGPHGTVLRFSPGIGAHSHQRFRNVFGLPPNAR